MLTRLARSFRRSSKARTKQAPALEALENRQMMAVSPVVAGSKLKGVNLSSNNLSTNQTLVTIPFSGNISLVDATKIRMFAYAINPLSAKLGQVKKTINISGANVLALDVNGDGVIDHSLLQFTTDRLARKGASIILNSGAINDSNGLTLATQTVKTVKGQNRERFTLACRAFVPTDFTRFTPDIFTASPTPTAASVAPSDSSITTAFTAFMDKKVTLGIITQAQETAAITRYNSDAMKGTVPDANLRAAIMSLTGTFAEAAISSFLDGTNVTGKSYTIITFQDPTDNTVPVAQTSVRSSDGRLRTVIKPKYAGESFEILSAFLAHEALHQDSTFTLQEEEVAPMVEGLVAMQQAQVDSSFLKTGTALVNFENDNLLAMLNSGQTIFPYPGLLAAPMENAAGGVFQGQKTPAFDGGGVFTSWLDYDRRNYIARGSVDTTSTGNPLLNTYYTNLTGKTPSANMKFSTQIIDDVDAFQGIIGTHAAIVVAQALRLGLA